MNVGFIGFGNFGKKLHEKFNAHSNVKFICQKKDDFLPLINQVDWLVVATPNETHYSIVKKCLENNKNVFCEKPLCLTYQETKKLIDLARQKNVLIYIDDVFLFRDEYQQLKNCVLNNKIFQIKFNWQKFGSFKDTILNNLTYHDLYLLADLFGKQPLNNIIIKKKSINQLFFQLNYGKIKTSFYYDRNFQGYNKSIELIYKDGLSKKIDFSFHKNDALDKMVKEIAFNKVNFYKNNQLAFNTNKLMAQIDKQLKPNIAIVGAGIFGASCAWTLAKNGYRVDLYEKNYDILQAASSINQYRLHRGYHYPRSKDTAASSLLGEKSFQQEYQSAILTKNDHYYCLAKDNSKTSADQFIKFMDNLGLEYQLTKLDIIKNENVQLTIKVNESLYDPKELKKICWQKIKKYKVNIFLNTQVNYDQLKKYNYVIIAAYASINNLLNQHRKQQKDYQFELCEKPLLKLPQPYKNKSIVILDGPFTCIDPFGDTNNFVMGNVIHAIHQTNVSKHPKIPDKFKNLINKGIIKNPPVTNIDKFIKSAEKFFINIEKARHIGSMFTYRTVLANHDHDDARPSFVEQLDKRTFVIFSGKVGTCIDVANEILSKLEKNNV